MMIVGLLFLEFPALRSNICGCVGVGVGVGRSGKRIGCKKKKISRGDSRDWVGSGRVFKYLVIVCVCVCVSECCQYL